MSAVRYGASNKKRAGYRGFCPIPEMTEMLRKSQSLLSITWVWISTTTLGHIDKIPSVFLIQLELL